MSDTTSRPMLGGSVEDKKKNTANAKRVNDRLRRRVKRNEKAMLIKQMRGGEFYSSLKYIVSHEQ